MKRIALTVIAACLSFVALLPLSWRLADPLFSKPFDRKLNADPVLLICPDRIDVLWLHKISDRSSYLRGTGCTYNVSPDRQKWVETEIRNFPSPNPAKSAWRLKIKQIGDLDQQINLELLGDGIFGMIYEVNRNEIVPLQSRLAGPGGAMYPLQIDCALCFIGYCIFWLVWMPVHRRSKRSLR